MKSNHNSNKKDKNYEPENMSNWFRLYAIQTTKDYTLPKGVVGICRKCERQVKKGEGVKMVNSFQINVWHRKCFSM